MRTWCVSNAMISHSSQVAMIVEWNITWPAVASPVPAPYYWSIVAPSAPSTVNCDTYSCSAAASFATLVCLLRLQHYWSDSYPWKTTMAGCPTKVLRVIGRSGKLQLTRGTRGVHTGDRGAAISGGNTIWSAGNFFSAVVFSSFLIMTCSLIRKSCRRSWVWCGAGRQLAWGQPGQEEHHS